VETEASLMGGGRESHYRFTGDSISCREKLKEPLVIRNDTRCRKMVEHRDVKVNSSLHPRNEPTQNCS
jgi:hypothetical protein